MIKLTTAANVLLYSTIRISTDNGCGTGFLFLICLPDGREVVVLVTNKHVVRGAIQGQLMIHKRVSGDVNAPAPDSYVEDIDEFEKKWIQHPSPSVDLCAMPFAPIIWKMKQAGKLPFYSVITSNQIAPIEELEDLSVLEDMVMIGYPNGIYDKQHNLPVFRKGVTASHPLIDFDGRPEFLIDMACFPGSSGSPVMLWNIGNLWRKQMAWLVGILYAGPVMRADGSIEIQEIPTSVRGVSKTDVMIHLGYVIKARELMVLVEYMQSRGLLA